MSDTKPQITPGVLKDFRKEFGLTQSDLAVKMGVSRRTIIRWEQGEIETADPFRLEKLRQVMHRWTTRREEGGRWK